MEATIFLREVLYVLLSSGVLHVVITVAAFMTWFKKWNDKLEKKYGIKPKRGVITRESQSLRNKKDCVDTQEQMNKNIIETGVFVLRCTKIWLGISIVLVIVTGILCVVVIDFLNDTSNWIVYSFFFLLFFGALFLTWYSIMWRVIVEEERLVIRSWTGENKIIYNEEISKIERATYGHFYIYAKGKKILELSPVIKSESVAMFIYKFKGKVV